MNDQVVITSAVRTPIGNFGGGLRRVSAAQLGTVVSKAVLNKTGLDPEQIDEVIFGCARQAGNGPNVARQVAWHTGVPEDRPAFTINKACASGLKAITLACQSIVTGENNIVLAGGVEQMSQIPYLLMGARWGYRLGDDTLVDAMYRDGYLCPLAQMVMGETAEVLVDDYGITREAQDEFAYHSHLKAVTTWEKGLFDEEVIPVEAPAEKGQTMVIERDERPRPDTSLEKLARLRPVFREDGAQVLAVERHLDWDVEKRNVHGGAVALGHPTGCSGTRIVVTLVHAMRQRNAEWGLATLCISGGMGMALLMQAWA